MARKNNIQLDYKRHDMMKSEEYFNTCVDILLKYRVIDKFNFNDFVAELTSKLPLIVEINTPKIPVKPLLKFIGKYFLFLTDEEMLKVQYSKKTTYTATGEETYYIYRVYGIPMKKVTKK